MKLTPLRFVYSPNEAKWAELKPETETKQCNKIMFGAIGIWEQSCAQYGVATTVFYEFRVEFCLGIQ